MTPPQQDRPLNDAECDRIHTVLSRFRKRLGVIWHHGNQLHFLGDQVLDGALKRSYRGSELICRWKRWLVSESAMKNVEEIDGFFAALICSPELVKPSEYLPEIWGGEMADDEAFTDRRGAQDFLSLLFRHWNNIIRILEKGEVFAPLLFEDEEGTAHGNDWARGFMRGVHFHHAAWEELFVDELYSPLVPILALAYEHDPDPEMRPYKESIDADRREKLILGVAAGVTAIYEYFGSERRRIAAELGGGRASYR